MRPRRCGEGRDHRAAHVLPGPGPGRLQAAAHGPRGLPRPHVGAAAGAQRGRVRLRLGVIPTAAEADGRPWGVVFVRVAVGAERTGGKKWGDRGPGTVDGGPWSGGCGWSRSEGPAVRGGARRPDHEPDPVAVPSSTPPLTRQCVRGPHRAPWRGVRTRSGAQPPPPRPGRGAGGQAAGPAAISGGALPSHWAATCRTGAPLPLARAPRPFPYARPALLTARATPRGHGSWGVAGRPGDPGAPCAASRPRERKARGCRCGVLQTCRPRGASQTPGRRINICAGPALGGPGTFRERERWALHSSPESRGPLRVSVFSEMQTRGN